ncbi:MAG: cobalt-precorrin-5B (C(1))-methyltransferase CbiD [Lachnospiraceae bacterium]|nr:cobalt-precorrin-5B (C(1))-methyltransferase CbiD [Lachnospiraceae bacterium]
MQYGFTTGSCSAAAAKAAAYMLLTGKAIDKITIRTPKGIPYEAELYSVKRGENRVSCAVKKDSGDDPDITNGTLVFAEVEILSQEPELAESIKKEPCDGQQKAPDDARVRIEGGAGVGTVTKPGLDQPVGNAAINRVPREMITAEVLDVCRLTDFAGELKVTISVPEGEELAKQTFNPRLGIEGGISILGTSGVVEPMSSQALLDTIYVELRQKKAEGYPVAMVSPGNYGLEFMQRTYGYDLDQSVKCSNFIGDTLDMAVELGFEKLLLTGHIGKLIKLSGGMMNTHSKEGDCRMELLAAAALRADTPVKTVRAILDCVTTEEAVKLIIREETLEETMAYVMERIRFYIERRTAGKLETACIVYANEFGELGRYGEVEEFLRLVEEHVEKIEK